jgi:hypothetical protein
MPITFDWSKTISELPGNPIPAEWLETKGKGVKVAFIDTGVNLGLASLNHLDKAGHKFFTSAPGFSVAKFTGQDPVGEAFGVAGPGHGTLYASLLAGKNPTPVPEDKDLVTGIANDADWVIIKATDPSGEVTTIRQLLEAIELSANLGVEIIITGQCLSKSEMEFENLSVADVDRVFNLPGVKKMFVFAPLKNRTTVDAWTDITGENFPSNREEAFNVAKLPEIFDKVSGMIKAQNIPFLPSGFQGQLLSKTGDAMDMDFSNSGAVALMGGIAVLALSAFKNQNAGALPSRDQFAALLGTCCNPLPATLSSVVPPAIFKKI